MTTPLTSLDVAAVLDRYRDGLRTVPDVELEHRAATVAALPGRLADELRLLINAERESRRSASRPARPTPTSGRSRVARVTASAAAVGVPVTVLTGRAMAEYGDGVPQALVYSPAVAVGLVAAVVGGLRSARWIDDRRHPLAVDVAEADLNPLGKEVLARARAQRLAHGETR